MRAMLPSAGSVVLGDADEPRAAADKVIVAVEAYSVNRGETFLLDEPPPGWRPGKDVAGTVVVAAASGDGPATGTRIVAHPESAGWAERVAVPIDRLAALPENVSTVVAAALPLAGLTALRLIRAIGALAGRRILITGASGGVGHYFTELAAAHGARVSVVVRDATRGERLLRLGATEVLTDVEEADGSYDVVVESVGGEVFPAAWRRLTTAGLFVWMGQASRRPPTIDFFDWRGGTSATLRKFLYSDDPALVSDDLATLVRLVATGRLHPEIDRVRSWAQTPDVIAALLARQIRGNAILEVTDVH